MAAPVTRVTSGPRVKSPIANRSFWGDIQHGGLLASLGPLAFQLWWGLGSLGWVGWGVGEGRPSGNPGGLSCGSGP